MHEAKIKLDAINTTVTMELANITVQKLIDQIKSEVFFTSIVKDKISLEKNLIITKDNGKKIITDNDLIDNVTVLASGEIKADNKKAKFNFKIRLIQKKKTESRKISESKNEKDATNKTIQKDQTKTNNLFTDVNENKINLEEDLISTKSKKKLTIINNATVFVNNQTKNNANTEDRKIDKEIKMNNKISTTNLKSKLTSAHLNNEKNKDIIVDDLLQEEITFAQDINNSKENLDWTDNKKKKMIATNKQTGITWGRASDGKWSKIRKELNMRDANEVVNKKSEILPDSQINNIINKHYIYNRVLKSGIWIPITY